MTFYRDYIALKSQNDELSLLKGKQSARIETRTVMVFGIPPHLRGETELASYFDHLSVGKVETVVLCRTWSRLQNSLKRRAEYLDLLEELVHKYQFDVNYSFQNDFSETAVTVEAAVVEYKRMFSGLAMNDRPTIGLKYFGCGRKIDLIDYYCEKFLFWDRRSTALRNAPELSASTGIAFITFEKAISAALVSQVILSRNPLSLLVKMAPEPRDLYWPNLSASNAKRYRKFFRSIVATGTMFLLISSSTFVVSSISTLVDLQQLGKLIPYLGTIMEAMPVSWRHLIEGVIPTVLLAGWNASLPSILLFLCQFQGLEAESWIQNALLAKYFFYLIWNVVIIIPASRSVVTVIVNPKEIIERMGEMLPKAAVTLINYISLQGLVLFPFQILLAFPILYSWVVKKWFRGTPRRLSYAYYPSILTIVDYGIILPMPLLIFCIGYLIFTRIIYSLINPIILPFCCIYFGIGFIIFKYIINFVHIPRYEAKGLVVPLIVNRCLFGLGFMQLTVMGVLVLKAANLESTSNGWSEYAKVVLSITPLLPLTYIVYTMLDQAYSCLCSNIPLEMFRSTEIGTQNDTSNTETTHPDHLNLQLPDAITLSEREDSPLLDNSSSHSVLETPMTRVQGILDHPLFPDEMKGYNDIQTYLHPALIGRLPMFWISNASFEYLRLSQADIQTDMLSRYSFTHHLPNERIESREDSKIQFYIDGLMSWIHYIIS